MSFIKPVASSVSWRTGILFVLGAAACFHLAYAPNPIAPVPWMVAVYLILLAQLARLETTRLSFYFGLSTGLLCVAPQLVCFWNIFGMAAVPLWFVLAFWIAGFVALAHVVLHRFSVKWALVLIPFLWTGLEYFRSELYYLRFSWMNVGYAFAESHPISLHVLGMYGVGFLAAVLAAFSLATRWSYCVALVAALIIADPFFKSNIASTAIQKGTLRIAGVQMEFPAADEIPIALDQAVVRFPKADLIVLSEYTLDGPVPEDLKNWCRRNHRYLIVGGKDPASQQQFYDSAFVVAPTGEIVFKQAKSVPIRFFKDGLPAPKQELWESPWGRIGICICYDLSYTRVTDQLAKLGAQLLIVPTMDVADWGRHQHELHALVAPVRAAEYHLPIFRLASSGISQAVDSTGRVVARADFPGQNEILFAELSLPEGGSLPLDRIADQRWNHGADNSGACRRHQKKSTAQRANIFAGKNANGVRFKRCLKNFKFACTATPRGRP